jgi:hypothetical protein
MKSWRKSATVWVNDPDKGRVLVGAFGFAWWTARKIHIAVFEERESQPMSSYRHFDRWDDTKSYWKKSTPDSAVHRFVKTGLLPG